MTGYALLAFAWLLAMPAGTHPDADAHYIRAVAASRGQLVGEAYTGPALDPSRFKLGQARTFTVPEGLAAPSTFNCDAGNLTRASVCSYAPPDNRTVTSQVSVEGTNSPFSYLLPALFMRLAKGPNGAELLGGIASLLTSLTLLAAAVSLLWTRRGAMSPVVGVLLAVTPSVLFLGGGVGPDGLESSATICFVAGLIRLSREDGSGPWTWVATAAAAVALALARPLGFAWVCVDIACWALVFGRRQVLRPPRSLVARAALGVGLVGFMLGVAWELANRLTPQDGFNKLLSSIPGVVDLIPQYLGDFVGRFGFSDTPLPQSLSEPWIACLLVVAGIAIAVANRRERLGVVGLLIAGVVVLVGYSAAFDSLLGGGLSYAQARHVLPFVLLVPLFVGETLNRRGDRLGRFVPDRLVLYCAILVALVQVGAFYYDARRYAVGTKGSFLFFLPGRAAWSPGETWLPLLVTAALGACLLVLGARADVHARQRDVSLDHAAERSPA